MRDNTPRARNQEKTCVFTLNEPTQGPREATVKQTKSTVGFRDEMGENEIRDGQKSSPLGELLYSLS